MKITIHVCGKCGKESLGRKMAPKACSKCHNIGYIKTYVIDVPIRKEAIA